LLKYWKFETGFLNEILVHRFSRIKIHNALALPVLSYGSKICTLRKKRIKTIDINRYENFHKNSRYTLFDHKRNEEILEKLNVELVDEN